MLYKKVFLNIFNMQNKLYNQVIFVIKSFTSQIKIFRVSTGCIIYKASSGKIYRST